MKEDEMVTAMVSKNEITYIEKSGKKKKVEMSPKEGNGNWGPDYERRRLEVQREANAKMMKPISHEIFKKTKEEKEELKIIKNAHKWAIKRQGLDPKKEMNPKGNLF